TAFVLRYRLAPRYRHPAPMQDVQRAVRLIRARAQEWKVDPRRVAIIGFSAGGHLASTAATHFDSGQTDASDPIDQQSCRPDLAILCYPVIAMATEYAHAGSRNNLFGPNPDPKLVEEFSNERRVTPQTPPTFLFHTTPDKAVVPENSILFYSALRRAGVPAELHIYSVGPHGVGLAQKLPEVSGWPQQCAAWLTEMGAFQQK
ncbi:MAG: alpha/beta hydrolase, partial [Planctomycetaceae bacterium]|nr:alpha/beta hydrolase [Planctomycetaceae bacterium]